jgi:hypothetical protein
MNQEKIENLWKWFLQNEQQIIDAVQNETASETLIENLDNLILDLGMFKWEIGRGKMQPWYLTISPNSDLDLLKVSREVIAKAPELDHWEFNHFEPAKEWDRTFVLYDNNMDEQQVDASDWNVVALSRGDGMIDLILEASNIDHLDDDTAFTAADLVVIGEIGEENRILKVKTVDIVSQLEDQHNLQKNHIADLKNNLDL